MRALEAQICATYEIRDSFLQYEMPDSERIVRRSLVSRKQL